MKLIIDEREHDLYEKCASLLQITPNSRVLLSKQVLPLGDILLRTDDNDADLLIIERKCLADLLASIKDGRYEEQSYRLLHGSGVPAHSIIYLVEGMFSQLRNPADKKIIFSAMTSLHFFKGFSTHRTAMVQETAEWLLHVADKIDRELAKGKMPYYMNKLVTTPLETNTLEENNTEAPVAANTSVADYCSVVKKVKKENVTPENIGEIILCQIPGISSVTAISIMKQFRGFSHFIEEIKTNPACLENIVTESNGKTRKISKNCIESIKQFLL